MVLIMGKVPPYVLDSYDLFFTKSVFISEFVIAQKCINAVIISIVIQILMIVVPKAMIFMLTVIGAGASR